MGTTTNRALRYPEGTVLANTLHTHIKNLADDVDAQLFDTGWNAAILGNGWVNYGGTFAPARYRRKAGIVYVQGLIMNGTIGSAVASFVLPAGYRPAATLIFASSGSGGLTRTDVDTNGNIFMNSGANGYWPINMVFPADV